MTVAREVLIHSESLSVKRTPDFSQSKTRLLRAGGKLSSRGWSEIEGGFFHCSFPFIIAVSMIGLKLLHLRASPTVNVPTLSPPVSFRAGDLPTLHDANLHVDCLHDSAGPRSPLRP